MAHKLRWFLTIVAAAVCVASLVVWIYSYWVSPTKFDRVIGPAGWSPIWLERSVGASNVWCAAIRGTWVIEWSTRTSQATEPNWDAPTARLRFAGISRVRWNGGGAKLRDGTYVVSWRHSVWFPIWYISAVFGAIAMGGAWSISHNRPKRGPTLCKSCGYDLRAGHDKCPECGVESHVKVGAANSTNTPSAPEGQC